MCIAPQNYDEDETCCQCWHTPVMVNTRISVLAIDNFDYLKMPMCQHSYGPKPMGKRGLDSCLSSGVNDLLLMANQWHHWNCRQNSIHIKIEIPYINHYILNKHILIEVNKYILYKTRCDFHIKIFLDGHIFIIMEY